MYTFDTLRIICFKNKISIISYKVLLNIIIISSNITLLVKI